MGNNCGGMRHPDPKSPDNLTIVGKYTRQILMEEVIQEN